MKGIKKNLIAGLFACAAFNAQAQAEVDPFSYGIKVGLSLCPYAAFDEGATINAKKPAHSVIDNMWFAGALHGEYAFNSYIGMGLELGYMKQGATLTAEKPEGSNANANTNTVEPSIGIHSYGITAPLYLSIYPIGREEETGILKINLGIAPYIPLSTTCSQDDKEITEKDTAIEKEMSKFDLQVHAALEYELNIGLSFGLNYRHGFLNKFNIKEDENPTIFNDSVKIKELKTGHLTLGLGYNLASLLSE